MNYSFFSSAAGAQAHQERMQVLANNIANINNHGFKGKNGVFTDLVYSNLTLDSAEESDLTTGAGTKMLKADTNFKSGPIETTGYELDYAIAGDGFFALYDPYTKEISYTRDGSFIMSRQPDGSFFLANDSGKYVLDPYGQPIVVENMKDDHNIGVYVFKQVNGMVNLGGNEFAPTEKNGNAKAIFGDEVLVRNSLEMSNVDFASEMVRVIETQRAFQLSLTMIQTSDEIENTINTLR